MNEDKDVVVIPKLLFHAIFAIIVLLGGSAAYTFSISQGMTFAGISLIGLAIFLWVVIVDEVHKKEKKEG